MVRRLLFLATCAALPVLAAEPKFDAATATNQLGIDLFRQLSKATPVGNLVISPYSIDSAFALAYSGADGTTRTEMASVLHFPDDDASLQTSFGSLRAALDEIARDSAAQAEEDRKNGNGGKAIEWYQANRLYGQQGYAFQLAFLDLMNVGYGAPFESLDFKGNAETARERINAWVEEQTRQKISRLIPSGALNVKSRLVLVNALYLKAPWNDPFGKHATQPLLFRLNSDQMFMVPTMTQTKTLGYLKESGFTVVSLEYKGSELQFVIILPDEGTSCETLADQLTTQRFHEWALGKWLHSALVELYLPKFKVKGDTLPLGSAMRELGMKQAFDDPLGSANFSRIATRRPDDEYLKLSEIFHNTFIDVDEEGTEATAATVVTMVGFGASPSPPKPIVVRVDRPFLFAIQHRASGACLFLGRITDPR